MEIPLKKLYEQLIELDKEGKQRQGIELTENALKKVNLRDNSLFMATKLFNLLGLFCIDLSIYPKAERLYQMALLYLRETKAENNFDEPTLLNNLARYLYISK